MKEVPDPDSYVGEEWVEFSGEPARTVSVRRIVYDADGNLMYDTTWDSSYVAEPKIVHVGTKPLPVEPAAPADTGGSGGGTTTPDTTTQGETQPGGTDTQPASN